VDTIHKVLAYLATKSEFLAEAPEIEDRVRYAVNLSLGLNIRVGSPEYRSWHNSLGNAMFHVINTPLISDEVGIAVEYRINGRRQRVDFIIAGENSFGKRSAVIVELKQWSFVEHSDLRDCVKTAVGRGIRDVAHPSYQAWSYARQLMDFYEYVEVDGIGIHPCAYVHNCEEQSILQASDQQQNLSRAPLFLKGQHINLRNFITERVNQGTGIAMLQQIDESRIRPGKQLVQMLSSMMKGNE